MSQLGQERRIGVVRNISALPSGADVGADIVEPPVRAIRVLTRRSKKVSLFDHLIGAREQRCRHSETERFRRA